MFRITYFFWKVIFLERLLFQTKLTSIAATFSEEFLFDSFASFPLAICQLVINWDQ